jgi:heterodisulfide reductase subunit B
MGVWTKLGRQCCCCGASHPQHGHGLHSQVSRVSLDRALEHDTDVLLTPCESYRMWTALRPVSR